ncbi:MAG: hypothetical protein P8Y71_23955 [Pseudolabrys sp.]|jgi:hypothetical protein
MSENATREPLRDTSGAPARVDRATDHHVFLRGPHWLAASSWLQNYLKLKMYTVSAQQG